MSLYKVSVLISTYNSGYYLKLAVDSVLNQTIGFENIELIIVDDKSDDEYTIRLLEKYENDYDNCKVFILDENTGFPGKPRNVAFEKATGDYVIFMDSDDTFSLDALETMYDVAVEGDYDFVKSNFKLVFNDRTEVYSHPDFKDKGVYIMHSLEENTDFLKLKPSLWSILYKREFLIENDIWSVEGVNGQDLEFITHSLLCAHKFIYLENYYGYNYYIRDRPNDKSSINNYGLKLCHGLVDGYLSIWDLLKKHEKEEYFPIIFEIHIRFFIGIFIQSSLSYKDKMEIIKKLSPLLKKQLQSTPDFLNNKCSPTISEPLFNDDYDEVLKNLNKSFKARLKVKSTDYDIFYKNENYNTLRFDVSGFDDSTMIFSPVVNKWVNTRCSIINIDTDFDISNIKALNSINKDSEQAFSEIPRYQISGDFSNGSFIEITFIIYEISGVETRLIKSNNLLETEKNKVVKENKELTNKNNKLVNENKKLNNELNFYKKLLNTKPYRFAKFLRNIAQKIRHLK